LEFSLRSGERAREPLRTQAGAIAGDHAEKTQTCGR
jgi:hypothetical protein